MISDEQKERPNFGRGRPDVQSPRQSLGDLLKSMSQVHKTSETSRSKSSGKTRLFDFTHTFAHTLLIVFHTSRQIFRFNQVLLIFFANEKLKYLQNDSLEV